MKENRKVLAHNGVEETKECVVEKDFVVAERVHVKVGNRRREQGEQVGYGQPQENQIRWRSHVSSG